MEMYLDQPHCSARPQELCRCPSSASSHFSIRKHTPPPPQTQPSWRVRHLCRHGGCTTLGGLHSEQQQQDAARFAFQPPPRGPGLSTLVASINVSRSLVVLHTPIISENGKSLRTDRMMVFANRCPSSGGLRDRSRFSNWKIHWLQPDIGWARCVRFRTRRSRM